MYPAGSHSIHEIPHIKNSSDIVSRIQFAARIEGVTSFFNHLCRQRDVACDYKITNFKSFNYFIVGDIEAGCYLNEINATRRRYTHRLIGYKRQLYTGALCRPEQDVLDHGRACIRVYPYFHFVLLLLNAQEAGLAGTQVIGGGLCAPVMVVKL
jgi:hypothetical protein